MGVPRPSSGDVVRLGESSLEGVGVKVSFAVLVACWPLGF
jgi:hypothetical protein